MIHAALFERFSSDCNILIPAEMIVLILHEKFDILGNVSYMSHFAPLEI